VQSKPGMTRDELRAIMGEPTEEYSADDTPSGFDPQMTWEAFEYQFIAFFNADDKARHSISTPSPSALSRRPL
jgi:hypothetical protein